jgi:hypothetical protein
MRHARGFALFEYLLALLLVGIAIAWGAGRYRDWRTKSEFDSFIFGMGTIVDAAKAQQSATGWREFDQSQLWRSAPEAWRVPASSAMRHNYGGTIAVAKVTHGGSTNAALQLTTPNIPRDVCAEAIKRLHAPFARVLIGSTTIKGWGTAPTTIATNATTACSSDQNSIIWLLL